MSYELFIVKRSQLNKNKHKMVIIYLDANIIYYQRKSQEIFILKLNEF